MTPTFVHLRVHTAYSLAEGAITIKDLAKACDILNMPAVGISDTSNLFGALEASLALAQSGTQPIIGTQLYIENNESMPDILPLIAQTEEGYRNLMKLVSNAYLHSKHEVYPVASWEDLKQYSKGIIALTGGYTWAGFDPQVGCATGGISRLILANKIEEAKAYLQQLHEIFENKLYIEITRHGLKEESILEPHLLTFAKDQNIPIVATNHAFFLDKEMFEAHDAFLCIAESKYVSQQDRRRLTPAHRFKSSSEMIALFKDLPEAIENTVNIARRISFMVETLDPILPRYSAGNGNTEEEELRQLASTGLKARMENQVFSPEMSEAEKEKLRTEYEERLETELKIIIQMGFPGYFLIVADFIRWAKEQKIPVGAGRGSGAGSLVAWALTITDMDPIRFGLIFERFLNPERVSMPDFDIDFCQERRDEVIKYVQEKYGYNQVAQIITFGKLQARAVLRDVGRVLQIPYPVVDRICKLVPAQANMPVSLKEAMEMEPKFAAERKQEEQVGQLLDFSLMLEGLYRHVSTHAAGVVIGDRPLDSLVPMYRDPASDMPVTQFNMKYVEQAGLVKFDFLGLKTLTVIQHTVDFLNKRGINLNVSTLPFDDKAAFDLLTRVETVGVFQLESSGMKDVLRKLKPDTFEDIIALVALYRPGPMDDIPRYIACKHGEQDIEYAHPMLEPILKETFGVMVYQEQVMKIAQDLADYSLGGADLLRRAMGKKIKSAMDAERAKFVKGATAKGIKETIADKIFDQMAKFSSYGFNKSHSAPYGLLAYHTALLKANYPIEFFAANMGLEIHHTEKLARFAADIKRMKLKLLPPDINASEVMFKPEGEDSLRYALAGLKGVGAAVMEKAVEERNLNGPYKSIFDFASRLDTKVINKRILESLIQGGAFDSLHPNRQQLFNNMDIILREVGSKNKDTSQQSLFAEALNTEPKLTEVSEWAETEKLAREKAIIGFYLTAHPLDGLEIPNTTSSDQFEHIKETKEITVAAVITDINRKISKSGKRFAYVSLSDKHSDFETTVFSEALNAYEDILYVGNIVSIKAILRVEDGSFSLNANSFQSINSILTQGKKDLELYVRNEGDITEIKSVLDALDAGTTKVTLKIVVDKHLVYVTLQPRYKISVDALKKLKTFMHLEVA